MQIKIECVGYIDVDHLSQEEIQEKMFSIEHGHDFSLDALCHSDLIWVTDVSLVDGAEDEN